MRHPGVALDKVSDERPEPSADGGNDIGLASQFFLHHYLPGFVHDVHIQNDPDMLCNGMSTKL